MCTVLRKIAICVYSLCIFDRCLLLWIWYVKQSWNKRYICLFVLVYCVVNWLLISFLSCCCFFSGALAWCVQRTGILLLICLNGFFGRTKGTRGGEPIVCTLCTVNMDFELANVSFFCSFSPVIWFHISAAKCLANIHTIFAYFAHIHSHKHSFRSGGIYSLIFAWFYLWFALWYGYFQWPNITTITTTDQRKK